MSLAGGDDRTCRLTKTPPATRVLFKESGCYGDPAIGTACGDRPASPPPRASPKTPWPGRRSGTCARTHCERRTPGWSTPPPASPRPAVGGGTLSSWDEQRFSAARPQPLRPALWRYFLDEGTTTYTHTSPTSTGPTATKVIPTTWRETAESLGRADYRREGRPTWTGFTCAGNPGGLSGSAPCGRVASGQCLALPVTRSLLLSGRFFRCAVRWPRTWVFCYVHSTQLFRFFHSAFEFVQTPQPGLRAE